MRDNKHRHRWLIVGTRPAGDRVIIEEQVTKALARERVEEFRRLLEGYESIDVEEMLQEGVR